MAGERTINFGADATDARYQIEDTGDGGDMVLVRDLDNGSVILLQYNATADQFEIAANFDAGGNDISNVGTLTSTAVNTGELQFDTYDITEDGTFSVSGGSSISYTLSGTYDRVVVDLDSLTASGSDTLQLQVNGDTGANYRYASIDGTNTTGASHIDLGGINTADFGVVSGLLDMDGRWTGPWMLSEAAFSYALAGTQGGGNGSVTSPLDSFALTTAGTETLTGEGTILGLDQ